MRSSWKSGAMTNGTVYTRVPNRGSKPLEARFRLSFERIALLQHVLDEARSSNAGEKFPLQAQSWKHLAVGEEEVLHRSYLRYNGNSQNTFGLHRYQRMRQYPRPPNLARMQVGN